ncbi:MAG: hypothetical protein Q8Q56_01015 [Alphaproteobacteria bacterium]|nr:hypothetical protein [Alphaproteobacteria bacterium]
MKDPDLFIRVAIKILGGSSGDGDAPDNAEFHDSEEDLVSRLEQLRLNGESA